MTLPDPHRPPYGTVLVVLHQEHSCPARIGRLIHTMGYGLDMRRPRYGDPLPETLRDYAGAIIFGGPMSANDPDDFVRREIAFVDVALREAKPLLAKEVVAPSSPARASCRSSRLRET